MKKKTANQQLTADGFECVEPGYWRHPIIGAICVWGKCGKWRAITPKPANELGPFQTATEAVKALKEYAEQN